LTILADLKARRGRYAEAKALYEQAQDAIEGMLISVAEPYWNSSIAATMSQTRDMQVSVGKNSEWNHSRWTRKLCGAKL